VSPVPKKRDPEIPAAIAKPSANRLLEIIAKFSQQTITLLGDLVLDQFVSGEISRVSREAPVLILRHRQTRAFPGGGANALNNLADLGAKVLPVGAVGDDAFGRTLLDYFSAKKIDLSGIEIVPGWTTPTKTRFLGGWTHTTEQQVLRVDDEPSGPLPPAVTKALEKNLRERVRGAQAILASDYGFGSASPGLLEVIRGSKMVTLDSRHSLLEFDDSGINAATPNEAELEELAHVRIGNNLEILEELGRRTLEEVRLKALLVTRGKDGMALFEPTQPTRLIPVYGSEEAVDVTGAGDTVIAAFTLALAAGATYFEAAHLANYSGGIVVMKRGTATLTSAELADAVGATSAS